MSCCKYPAIWRTVHAAVVAGSLVMLLASNAVAAEKTYTSTGELVLDSVFTRSAANAAAAKPILEAECSNKFSSAVTLKAQFDEDICKPAPDGCTFVESTDVAKCKDANSQETPSEVDNIASRQGGFGGDCSQCVTGICHYDCPNQTVFSFVSSEPEVEEISETELLSEDQDDAASQELELILEILAE